jgi:hypothetical protein
MTAKPKRLVVSIAGALVIVAGASVVYAAGSGRGDSGLVTTAGPRTEAATITCTSKQTMQSYVNHGDFNTTNSTSFVDLPGASVRFTVGRGAKCVSVLFTSMAFASRDDEVVFVRALLDGTVVAEPSETQFSGDDDEDRDVAAARSHAMNFLFAPVAAGSHTVQMQFRSAFGDMVTIHRGSTIVLYA